MSLRIEVNSKQIIELTKRSTGVKEQTFSNNETLLG